MIDLITVACHGPQCRSEYQTFVDGFFLSVKLRPGFYELIFMKGERGCQGLQSDEPVCANLLRQEWGGASWCRPNIKTLVHFASLGHLLHTCTRLFACDSSLSSRAHSVSAGHHVSARSTRHARTQPGRPAADCFLPLRVEATLARWPRSHFLDPIRSSCGSFFSSCGVGIHHATTRLSLRIVLPLIWGPCTQHVRATQVML